MLAVAGVHADCVYAPADKLHLCAGSAPDAHLASGQEWRALQPASEQGRESNGVKFNINVHLTKDEASSHIARGA